MARQNADWSTTFSYKRGNVAHNINNRMILFTIYAVIIIVGTGCGLKPRAGVYDYLAGHWETERGIVMKIEVKEGDAQAQIERAPGFRDEQNRSGRVIIDRIQPLVDGGYSGYFLMPDDGKPLRIRISFRGKNVLFIEPLDMRARGRRMIWKRVDN